ncbi:hypothetical protein ASPVEDRAFT_155524 [Aspergillus versicolor CBS 583.65]|uniref:VOC domain-containing protein n=1 Tax=Aspergillus versicolor CBS 583.65 TaxID=1036611 RepID=A0A1L9Q1S4_ASPVE|nr:uncharacterized protein ASPVEDRAFT_155524 [Aspergillus versicolor CBS 583.65]OJJ07737.1 hypothetical protein ASPVEDRAFT_155524 [Aspergillus versicolor CBS 583.65]
MTQLDKALLGWVGADRLMQMVFNITSPAALVGVKHLLQHVYIEQACRPRALVGGLAAAFTARDWRATNEHASRIGQALAAWCIHYYCYQQDWLKIKEKTREWTDHHAFFFKPAKPGLELNVAHAAFEVHDFDIQQLGHQHLRDKGYKLCWGVGRHVLGSQVFDYWFDSSGFVVEHYADGDLVNYETPVAKVQAGPQALSVWGPPVPDVF